MVKEKVFVGKKNLETHLALVRALRVPCLIQGSDQAPPPSRLPGPRPPGSPPPRRTSLSRCVPSGRTSSLRYITHIQGEGGGRSIIKIPACENILKSFFLNECDEPGKLEGGGPGDSGAWGEGGGGRGGGRGRWRGTMTLWRWSYEYMTILIKATAR